MNYRRYRYVTEFSGKAGATRVKANKVPEGFVLEVTQFSGGLMTEDTKKTELGYTDVTGIDRPVAMAKHDDFRNVEMTGECWLVANEIPYVEISNMGDEKTGFISIHGKLWPTEEQVIRDAEIQQEDNLPDDSKP